MSVKLLAIAVGTAGALLLGYCIYFDRKRRNDPEYKKKVHERRQREAEKRHFIYEFKLGEQLINQGNLTDGITHLANAIMMFAQPVQGLRTLQETMPKHILVPLIMKLHDMQNMSSFVSSSSSSSNMDYSSSSRDIL